MVKLFKITVFDFKTSIFFIFFTYNPRIAYGANTVEPFQGSVWQPRTGLNGGTPSLNNDSPTCKRGVTKKIKKKIARSITLHAIGQNWLKKNGLAVDILHISDNFIAKF